MAYKGPALEAILCEQYERVVGKDNCVSFEGMALQIPADTHRMNYMRVTVKVHRYLDGRLALFHGPRQLGIYDCHGKQEVEVTQAAA